VVAILSVSVIVEVCDTGTVSAACSSAPSSGGVAVHESVGSGLGAVVSGACTTFLDIANLWYEVASEGFPSLTFMLSGASVIETALTIAVMDGNAGW